MITQTSIIKILAIIAGAFLVDKFGQRMIRKTLDKVLEAKAQIVERDEKREKTLEEVLMGSIKTLIWIGALLIVLPELGINMSVLLGGVGVAGLAIGMASKQVIADYINGFFIILNDQYRVGDEVEVAGRRGVVVDIDFRRTILEEEDGRLSFIPHSKVDVTAKKQ